MRLQSIIYIALIGFAYRFEPRFEPLPTGRENYHGLQSWLRSAAATRLDPELAVTPRSRTATGLRVLR